MNSQRLYYILLGVVSLLALGLLGGAYGADQLLQKRSTEVVAARSKSQALEQQQTQLTAAKASITKYRTVAAIAKSIVPQDKDQAQTVRELVKIAGDRGITLGTISFPSSTLGLTAAGAVGSTATSAPATAGAAASAGNSPSNLLSQLTPVKGLSGVYTLQIIVQSDAAHTVKYDKFVDFLAALERNRRTALVSSINLQPDQKDPNSVSFSLTINEYVKP